MGICRDAGHFSDTMTDWPNNQKKKKKVSDAYLNDKTINASVPEKQQAIHRDKKDIETLPEKNTFTNT